MSHIALSLFNPILSVICGAGISAIMSMPKTSVYEYSDFLIKENKIRMSFNFIISSPARYSILLENLYQLKFRRLVIFRSHSTHYLRALFIVKYIRHNSYFPYVE